jgi:hypothetical protein
VIPRTAAVVMTLVFINNLPNSCRPGSNASSR